MFVQRTQRTDGRIVSISQPHVRPIVRGKAGAKVEFGAKLSASLDGGYLFLDQLDWNNFNESKHLISQVETYHQRRGYYPTSGACLQNLSHQRKPGMVQRKRHSSQRT